MTGQTRPACSGVLLLAKDRAGRRKDDHERPIWIGICVADVETFGL